MAVDTLLGKMIDDGIQGYYREDFRNEMEVHLPYLRVSFLTYDLSVPPDQAYRYEGDFYGLLTALVKMPKQYLWICMRMNDMQDPTEYKRDRIMLRLPQITEIDSLYSAFRPIQNIR